MTRIDEAQPLAMSWRHAHRSPSGGRPAPEAASVAETPKQFLTVAGKPVIRHAAEALLR